MAETQTQVVIVGTSGIICDCLANELARIEGLSVVHLHLDLKTAAEAIASEAPDVVLLDHYQDGEAVFRLTDELTHEEPAFKVLLLGTEDHIAVVRIARAGGKGYVWLGDPFAVLPAMIEKVRQGGIAVSGGKIAEKMFKSTVRRLPLGLFTGEELTVLSLMFERYTDQEISNKTGLPLHKVKRHVHNILKKFGVRTRHQAARMAAVEGFIEPGRIYDAEKDPAAPDQGRQGTPPDEAAAP